MGQLAAVGWQVLAEGGLKAVETPAAGQLELGWRALAPLAVRVFAVVEFLPFYCLYLYLTIYYFTPLFTILIM